MSVSLWDLLGKPKNMRPYSVFYGEEEHVLLYAKKTGFLVDATGNQFGNKLLARRPAVCGSQRRYLLRTLQPAWRQSVLDTPCALRSGIAFQMLF